MKKFIFILALMGLIVESHALYNPFKSQKLLVKIGDRSTVLSQGTSCKSQYWGNSSVNSCKCCLVKHSLGARAQVLSARDINGCIKKGRCSVKILEQLQSGYSVASFPEILAPLLKEVKVVETVTVATEDFHPLQKKQVTEKGIQAMFLSLQQSGKVKDSPYAIEHCFQVKSFSETNTGMFSSQLFGVFVDESCAAEQSSFDMSRAHLKYIVKEVAKGTTELRRMEALKASPLGQYSLSNPSRPVGFPAIAFNELSSMYKDRSGKKHYMTVLTAAPGKPFFDLINNFNALAQKKDISHKETVKVEKAYRSFGKAMGLLHSTYMTKDSRGRLTGKSHAVHGDLHMHNVFFLTREDEDDDLITLIDVETMAHALKQPQDVAQDLRKSYIFTARTLPTKSLARKFTPSGSIDQNLWHMITIKPFLEAYVDAYVMTEDGKVDRERLEDVMKILNHSYLSIFSSRKQLGFIALVGVHNFMKAQKKYLKPIIDLIYQQKLALLAQ